MSKNKNQHFVPRCYFRPFTSENNGKSINIFNVTNRKLIKAAAVKHQCSGGYFYGTDSKLDAAISATESAYSRCFREVIAQNKMCTENHEFVFRRFIYLQHLRTEAASRQSAEMFAKTLGQDINEYSNEERRNEIRNAVIQSMHIFAETAFQIDDLKVCFVKNRTSTKFYTSDDPSIVTNVWHLKQRGLSESGFGIQSAGTIFLIPLSPDTYCVLYDGSVYTIEKSNKWVFIDNPSEAHALNEHQFLNCSSNIYFKNNDEVNNIEADYENLIGKKPKSRQKITFAALAHEEGMTKTYREIPAELAPTYEDVLVHTQKINIIPSSWPRFIRQRRDARAYTNRTRTKFIRRRIVENGMVDPAEYRSVRL